MEHNLEVALENIIQLAKQNPEFNRELRKRLQIAPSANSASSDKNTNETNLAETFDAFVKLQHDRCKKKARLFYDNISNPKLYADLVSSYSEMLWYKSIHETGRYFMFLNHQIENMVNYYCNNHDCWSKIKSKPANYDKFVYRYYDNNAKENKEYIYTCRENFFSPKTHAKIELNRISLWPKIIFWAFHSNNRAVINNNFSNLNDIMRIRNIMSHSNSERPIEDLLRIQKWENPEAVFSYGHLENILKIIKETID